MPKHKRFQKGREKFREKAWDLKKLFKAGVRIHKIAYNTNKTTYLGRTLSVIAVTLIPFLSSWTGGKVIDALVSTIKGENGTTQQLVIIISIYVGVLALERIIGAFRSYFNNTLWMELIGEITIRIQKAFSRLDLEHYNNPQYNDMLQKVKDSYGHRPTTFLNRSYYIISDVISNIKYHNNS